MLPSFGSRSSPADVPHFRPAGSSPQLRVTLGAGFGNPSPVIGFATLLACADTVAAAPEWTYAVSRPIAHAPNMGNRNRGLSITPPRGTRGLWRNCRAEGALSGQ